MSVGIPGGVIAYELITSREYCQDVVTLDYADLLHRNPDAGGLNDFTNYLLNGVRDEVIIAFLASSQEYYNKA
jgi:hypothetical protein